MIQAASEGSVVTAVWAPSLPRGLLICLSSSEETSGGQCWGQDLGHRLGSSQSHKSFSVCRVCLKATKRSLHLRQSHLSTHHRAPAWFGLEGTLKIISFQTPFCAGGPFHHPRSPSSLALGEGEPRCWHCPGLKQLHWVCVT